MKKIKLLPAQKKMLTSKKRINIISRGLYR